MGVYFLRVWIVWTWRCEIVVRQRVFHPDLILSWIALPVFVFWMGFPLFNCWRMFSWPSPPYAPSTQSVHLCTTSFAKTGFAMICLPSMKRRTCFAVSSLSAHSQSLGLSPAGVCISSFLWRGFDETMSQILLGRKYWRSCIRAEGRSGGLTETTSVG